VSNSASETKTLLQSSFRCGCEPRWCGRMAPKWTLNTYSSHPQFLHRKGLERGARESISLNTTFLSTFAQLSNKTGPFGSLVSVQWSWDNLCNWCQPEFWCLGWSETWHFCSRKKTLTANWGWRMPLYEFRLKNRYPISTWLRQEYSVVVSWVWTTKATQQPNQSYPLSFHYCILNGGRQGKK